MKGTKKLNVYIILRTYLFVKKLFIMLREDSPQGGLFSYFSIFSYTTISNENSFANYCNIVDDSIFISCTL